MTGGSATASERMTIDSGGNIVVSGGDVTVNGSQQITSNLNVDGNLVLGSTTLDADSLAVLEGITLGETTNGKVITQGNTGVTKIGTTNGPEILDIASHNTTSSGLKLAGDLVTSNAAEINVLHNVTGGIVSASGAVVVDQNKDITGFKNITASGNLTTSSITLGGTAISSSAQDINKIESVVDGTVSGNKAVVAGTDNSVTGFSNVELTGKLTTGELKLGGTDVTASSTEINYLTSVTKGTAASNKAIVTDENTDIAGLRNVSTTGTISSSSTVTAPTINAGNINMTSSNIGIGATSDLIALTETSVTLNGTLNTPSLKLGGVSVTAPAEKINIMENVVSTSSEINLLNTSTAGTVKNGKAVIYGANGEISANSLTSANLLNVGGVSTLGEVAIANNEITTPNPSGLSLNDNNLTTTGTITANTIEATTINASGDLTIDGDLTVNGTTTTINTSNIVVQDPIMVLSSNANGSATVDSGLIIERGTDTNMGIIWDESKDQFSFISTSDAGNSAPGNINIDTYQNIQAGGLILGNDTASTLINKADIDIIHNVSHGTLTASKVLTADSNKHIDEIRADTLYLGDSENSQVVTATGNEINLLDGSIPNTVVNEKAVIYSAQGNVQATTLTTTGISNTASGSKIGKMTITDTSIITSDATKSISLSDNSLVTTGNISATDVNVTGKINLTGVIEAASGSKFGDVTIANGSITSADVDNNLTFGSNNLSTTGTLSAGDSTFSTISGTNITASGNGNFTGTITAAGGSSLGNLTFTSGSIVSASNAIDFGVGDLSTTGTLATGDSTLGNVTSGSIDASGAITTASTLDVTGNAVIGKTTITANSITNSDGSISFGSNNLVTTGSVNIGNVTSGNITSGSVTSSGDGTFTGILTAAKNSVIGNITIGEGSYIGTGVTVLENVVIGKKTIIGAFSLVNKSIPANQKAYGVPCKIQDELDDH